MALIEGAAAFFLDARPFLEAVAADPEASIVKLRDAPAAFGKPRSYLGATAIARLHGLLLREARRYWKDVDPQANLRSVNRRAEKP